MRTHLITLVKMTPHAMTMGAKIIFLLNIGEILHAQHITLHSTLMIDMPLMNTTPMSTISATTH